MNEGRAVDPLYWVGLSCAGLLLASCELPPSYFSEIPAGVSVPVKSVRGTGGALYVRPGRYVPPPPGRGPNPYNGNPQLRYPGPPTGYIVQQPRYAPPPPRHAGNPGPSNPDFGRAAAPFLAAAISGAVNSQSPNLFRGGAQPAQQREQNQPKKGKKHKKKDDNGQQAPSQPSQGSGGGSQGGPGGGPPGGGPPQG